MFKISFAMIRRDSVELKANPAVSPGYPRRHATTGLEQPGVMLFAHVTVDAPLSYRIKLCQL
ncbi:MAG: hypothetical protein AAF431_06275 [Pseudomonadota bacterium]